jgi:hypothetical protein
MSEPFEVNDYQKGIIRTKLKMMFVDYENFLELLITVNENLRKENIEMKKQLDAFQNKGK